LSNLLPDQLFNASIPDAINKRLTIEVFYTPGLRIIEPHAIGYGSEGQILIRAFQTSGASASGEHVNWKLLRLDRLHRLRYTGEVFAGPRFGYRRNDSAMKKGIIAQL
jgi:hypothetical protein